MKSPGHLQAIAIALGAMGIPAFAQESAQRQRFSISGHGSIQLDVPKEWQVASRPVEDPPSVVFRFRPASGDAFSIQGSSLWLDTEQQARLTPELIRALVGKAAEDSLAKAVETEAAVKDLRGKETDGFYYSSTLMKSSNTGKDYKYFTQGTFRIGPLVTFFIIEHRDPGAAEREQGLRCFAGATYSAGEPAAARTQGSGIRVDEVDQDFRLSVPGSRLVMTIPRGGLKKKPVTTGGSTDHPGYFHLVDEEQAIVVSGWFEPAGGFRGLQEFWAGEKRELSKSPVGDPQEVSFGKLDQWETILYDMQVPGRTNTHLRAELVQAGTWIDLHASVTSKRSSEESRALLLRTLKAFQVKEKD